MEVDDTAASAATTTKQSVKSKTPLTKENQGQKKIFEENGDSRVNKTAKGSRRNLSLTKKSIITPKQHPSTTPIRTHLVTADEDMDFDIELDKTLVDNEISTIDFDDVPEISYNSMKINQQKRSVSTSLSATSIKLAVSSDNESDNDVNSTVSSPRSETTQHSLLEKKPRLTLKETISNATNKNSTKSDNRGNVSSVSPSYTMDTHLAKAVNTISDLRKSLLGNKRKQQYKILKDPSDECLVGFNEGSGEPVFRDVEETLKILKTGNLEKVKEVTHMENDDLMDSTKISTSKRELELQVR